MSERPICPTCAGYGAVQHRGSQGPCETCHGAGRVDPSQLIPTQLVMHDMLVEPSAVMMLEIIRRDYIDLRERVVGLEDQLHTLRNRLQTRPEPGVPDIASPSPVPTTGDPGGVS